MSGAYYKYAERQADSQINWAQVGKDMSDMLKKEVETREAKKDKLDEASRQFGQELENAPQGASDDVNRWTTDFAGDMQEFRLIQDRLFKSGQLKTKDYLLMRQNSLDGTKNLFSLAKEYQEEYKTKMERRQQGVSSAAEAQFMAMVEGFANLRDTKALINPTDGSISVGRMESGPDGVRVLAEGADNYMTVNQLRNRIKEKVDKYDVNANLEAETKLLGDVVIEVVKKTGSATETGFLEKITDPTRRVTLTQDGSKAVDAYINLEKQILNAQLSNPFNVSSVLFDWAGGVDKKTGKPYQVTLDKDKAEKDSSLVLWTFKNGVFQPDFESTKHGKDQRVEAENYMRTKFRGMLEQKSELEPFNQPRKDPPQPVYEWQYRAGQERKNAAEVGNMIGLLYSGTPAQQQAAVSFFAGSPTVKEVTRNDDGVTVTLMDGTSKNISFKNPTTGQLMSKADFVRSASNLLLGDASKLNEVLKGAIGAGTQFSSGSAVSKATVPAGLGDPRKAYNTYVEKALPTVLPTKQSKAVEIIEKTYGKLGFNAKATGVIRDLVVISNGQGAESEEINLKEPGAAEKIKNFVLNNVPGKDEKDKIIYLMGLMKSGVFNPDETPNPGGAPVVNPSGVGSKY